MRKPEPLSGSSSDLQLIKDDLRGLKMLNRMQLELIKNLERTLEQINRSNCHK